MNKIVEETAKDFAVELEETIGTSPHSAETVRELFSKFFSRCIESMWRSVENPPESSGDTIVVLCRNKNKEDGIWLADIIQSYEGSFDDGRENWEKPMLWTYLDNLLPEK